MTASCFLNLEECREGGLRGLKISQAAKLGKGLTKGIAWPAESCKRALKRREEREKGVLESMWGATRQRLSRETCWSRAQRDTWESTWQSCPSRSGTDGAQGRAGCLARSPSISLRQSSVVSPLRTLWCAGFFPLLDLCWVCFLVQLFACTLFLCGSRARGLLWTSAVLLPVQLSKQADVRTDDFLVSPFGEPGVSLLLT